MRDTPVRLCVMAHRDQEQLVLAQQHCTGEEVTHLLTEGGQIEVGQFLGWIRLLDFLTFAALPRFEPSPKVALQGKL